MFQSIEAKHPHFYQIFRIIVVIFASILYAWNLCCFAKTAGLFPGGFSGVSLLLQEIGIKYLHINIPYTVFNVILNVLPIYIGFKFIGKKFTLYSILTIFLSSIFVDILPTYVFTDDVLLISVFGGLLNGFAISLCLNVGTTTGGTDFISIYMSQQKGIDAWNYILLGNVIMLIIAGAMFGWSIALYSIIYQFCSTQVIQMLYKRYKKETLFIISDIVILPNKIIFTYLILINKIKVIAHYINKEKRNNYFFILSLLFFFIYYRTYVKHNI